MNSRLLIWMVLIVVIGIPAAVVAQGSSCPVIVQTAMETVADVCDETGRNQACYGNILLTAEAQAGIDNLVFDAPGDVVNVADIGSLTLSPMDETAGKWGVSLMRLQANLPDTLPGQNVTVLMFGDVTLQPTFAPVEIEVTVIATNGVNVRSGPSANNPMIDQLDFGSSAPADGRNTAGDWLRVHLPDGRIGWVFAQYVMSDDDPAILNAFDGQGQPQGHIAGFVFQSGIGDAPCAEAPSSGILVQTPDGAAQISLRVNDVDIALASTAFLQAQPGESLAVNVIEGQAEVTAFDVTRTVPAGTRVTVPLTDDLQAAAPPDFTEVYRPVDVQALPVRALPRLIDTAPPLAGFVSEADVCAVTASTAVNLRSGPGTVYPAVGGLAASTREFPTGQAMGRDGFTWWRLANGQWVRSDVVEASSLCNALPVILDLPPVPTLVPTLVPTAVPTLVPTPQIQVDTIPGNTIRPIETSEQWTLVTSLVEDTCDSAGRGATVPVTIVRTSTGGSLTWFNMVYPLSSKDGVNYFGSTTVNDSSVYSLYLTFTSPTTLVGEQNVRHSESCRWRFSVSGRRN